MPGSIIQTKLYVPSRRGAIVSRPRLGERLNRGLDSRLMLVSAPAGFGKTTLLASWLASTPQAERLTAWLSLDQSDNDPTAFWTYVIAAVETVAPAVGAPSLALLGTTRTPTDVVLGASDLLSGRRHHLYARRPALWDRDAASWHPAARPGWLAGHRRHADPVGGTAPARATALRGDASGPGSGLARLCALVPAARISLRGCAC
jgi:hypothetical protein